MFNLAGSGIPICKIVGDSKLKNKIVSMTEDDEDEYIKSVKEIQLQGDNKFELVPNTKADRDVIYYSGPAGSGKSYLMASYLRNYKKSFKSNGLLISWSSIFTLFIPLILSRTSSDSFSENKYIGRSLKAFL